MPLPIVIALLVIAATGAVAMIRLSAVLRAEVRELLGAFDRTAPVLIPLRVEVSDARESLARRLDEYGGDGSGPAPDRR